MNKSNFTTPPFLSLMLFLAAACVMLTSSASEVTSSVSPPNQAAAATALVQRIMGASLAKQFTVEMLPTPASAPATNSFSTDTATDTIVLRGSTGVEVANALNQYLNNYLNVTVDWNTYGKHQLPPDTTKLPRPSKTVTKTRKVPWSYYMNVCTYGTCGGPSAFWITTGLPSLSVLSSHPSMCNLVPSQLKALCCGTCPPPPQCAANDDDAFKEGFGCADHKP